MDIVTCDTIRVAAGLCPDGVSKVIVLLALLHDVLSHATGCQSDSELPSAALHHNGKPCWRSHPALMNELFVAQPEWA